MTAAGWILMLGSCGCVTLVALYCYYRVLKTPEVPEHLHAPLDIDTHDTET